MQSQDPQSDTVQVETNERRQPLQVVVNGQVEIFDDLPQQEFNGKNQPSASFHVPDALYP